MREYLIAAAAFITFGIFLFLIYRRWFWHLVRLAGEHPLEERRRIASRWSPAYLLTITAAIGCTLLPLIRSTRLPILVIVFGFLASALPGFAWFARRWTKLRELGYPY